MAYAHSKLIVHRDLKPANMLVTATAVSSIQAREATRQAQRATATKNFLIGVFRANDPRIASERPRGEITARELLNIGPARIEKNFAGQPELQIELRGLIAKMYNYMSDDPMSLVIAAARTSVRLARAAPYKLIDTRDAGRPSRR